MHEHVHRQPLEPYRIWRSYSKFKVTWVLFAWYSDCLRTVLNLVQDLTILFMYFFLCSALWAISCKQEYACVLHLFWLLSFIHVISFSFCSAVLIIQRRAFSYNSHRTHISNKLFTPGLCLKTVTCFSAIPGLLYLALLSCFKLVLNFVLS